MKKGNFFKKVLLVAVLTILFSTSAKSYNGPQWIHNAVFYQIYPCSYMDTDGNGYGDLPGIISKLDYIKSIGVDAIWLNPIFLSGWFDGGYDIIDFYKVDPRFGTNSDVVKLTTEAHKRGLKVCLDLVAGHTSEKSEWFKQSANDDVNSHYANYYIWANEISQKEKDAITERYKEPNPKASTKGHFVEANAPRAKYYLKNYYECQPALNYGYANPDPKESWQEPVTAPGPKATRQELRNIMAFWFGKGVDGFRVDMASSLVKNDPDKKETMKLWKDLTNWMHKEYPECVLISEWSNPRQSLPAGFNVDLLLRSGKQGYPQLFFEQGTPYGSTNKSKNCYFNKAGKGSYSDFFKNYNVVYPSTKKIGYIGIPTGNHDMQRVNIGTRNTPDQLKVLMTFILTMPGTPFIYYGDEIGMKYQMNLPSKEGSRSERAGARTPMQWDNSCNAGFSTAASDKLYYPVDTEKGKLCVASQEKDKKSLLNYVRQLLKLRHSAKAIGNDGDWEQLSDVNNPYPWVYKRMMDNDVYIITINPSNTKVSSFIKAQHSGKNIQKILATGTGSYKSGVSKDEIKVNPVSAIIFKIK